MKHGGVASNGFLVARSPLKVVAMLAFTLCLTGNLSESFGQDTFSPTFSPVAWGQVHFVNDATAGTESSFQLKRIRFGAKGKVNQAVGYAFLAETVGSSPKLLQAWVDYNLSPLFKIRVGQFKYRFGLEGYEGSPMWKFINPSYVTGGISKKLGRQGAAFRDIGVQLAGKTMLGSHFSFGYSVMAMNGNGINTLDKNGKKDLVFHADFGLPLGINVGTSYFNGHYTETESGADQGESGIGLDFQLKRNVAQGAFRLQGEYIVATYETNEADVKPGGYYVYATYFVLPDVELGIRYDSFEPNTEAAVQVVKKSTTLGLGYYLGARQRISLNYEIRSDSAKDDMGDLLTLQFQVVL